MGVTYLEIMDQGWQNRRSRSETKSAQQGAVKVIEGNGKIVFEALDLRLACWRIGHDLQVGALPDLRGTDRRRRLGRRISPARREVTYQHTANRFSCM
jgi:hypothetical protein